MFTAGQFARCPALNEPRVTGNTTPANRINHFDSRTQNNMVVISVHSLRNKRNAQGRLMRFWCSENHLRAYHNHSYTGNVYKPHCNTG